MIAECNRLSVWIGGVGIIGVIACSLFKIQVDEIIFGYLFVLGCCLYAKAKGRSAWWGLSLFAAVLLRDRSVPCSRKNGYLMALKTLSKVSIYSVCFVVYLWISAIWVASDGYNIVVFLILLMIIPLLLYFARSVTKYFDIF